MPRDLTEQEMKEFRDRLSRSGQIQKLLTEKEYGDYLRSANQVETPTLSRVAENITELFNLASQLGEVWECTVTLRTPTMALSWQQRKDSKPEVAGDNGPHVHENSDSANCSGIQCVLSEHPEGTPHQDTDGREFW